MSKIGHYAKRIKEGRLREIVGELRWVYGYGRKHIFAIIFYTLLGMSGSLTYLWSSLVSRDLVDLITGHKTGAHVKNHVIIIGNQSLNTHVRQC